MQNGSSPFLEKYGPWALIAGASEGLGEAFARELAKRGLNLVLIARRKDVLAKTAKRITSQYPVKVNLVLLDLADLSNLKKTIEDLEMEIGLLVYNAAYSPIGYFESISAEDLLKAIWVNVEAPLLLTKLLSVKMVDRKRGGIVLMSSLSGLQGSPKIATYAATKAFNTILAEGLWHELKDKQVDVMACVAGAVRTPGYNASQNGKKDAPGTLDAESVVVKTLNALGSGPSIIPGFINKIAHFVMGRLLPRKTSISIMYNNTKELQ